MAYGKTDIRRNTVRGQYTWSYLFSYPKSREVRKMIASKALSDKHGIPNGGFLCSICSTPPVGPPILRLWSDSM